MFVTFNNLEDERYGGGQCSYRNYVALNKFINTDYIIIQKKNTISSLSSILEGNFPPLAKSQVKNILERLNYNYQAVWLDSSLLGSLAQEIKKKYPKLLICSFFHNVEYDYISVRMGFGIKKYIYQIIAKKNERLVCKHSDTLIALNLRDKKRIEGLYKAIISKIIPISFEDKVDKLIMNKEDKDQKYIKGIFVGAYGRANYEGIKWFLEKTSLGNELKIQILGKGFEECKNNLENHFSNCLVEVIGTVDNLEPYYREADFVLIPLLFGAGMKVKVAEAMMYGKTIIATPEAWEGYDVDYSKIGAICSSIEEMDNAILKYRASQKKYNKYSRECFLDKYSIAATDILFQQTVENMFQVLS